MTFIRKPTKFSKIAYYKKKRSLCRFSIVFYQKIILQLKIKKNIAYFRFNNLRIFAWLLLHVKNDFCRLTQTNSYPFILSFQIAYTSLFPMSMKNAMSYESSSEYPTKMSWSVIFFSLWPPIIYSASKPKNL